MTAPTISTVKDLLASRGLVPRQNLVLVKYDAAQIAQLRSTWDSYADRGAELGLSVAAVAGFAAACADLVRSQDDPKMVRTLAPYVARLLLTDETTPLDVVIERATRWLTYFVAQRSPVVA